MRKVEELFTSTSPKLLLDHYWNVLDLIGWRGFIEPKDKEHFTISDLAEKLSKDIQGSENPFYTRMCSRSKAIIEAVVSELVSLGLLIKDGETLRKTDDFSKFYYVLKDRIKNSLRRRVAWAILYLYSQRQLTSFSTTELVSLLSYRDEDYINEIPHLTKWKENRWLKLLEKSGERWKLLEKPRVPSEPILLTDIDGRLSIAIFELSKFKDNFLTQEIIQKLRELELRNAERTLERFGLEYENEKWQADNRAIENFKNLLITEAKRWPCFGILVFKNPYFKLQSRTMYVDVPNMIIWSFLSKLERVCYEFKDEQEKMYEKAKELATTFNQSLEKDLGRWIFFVVRKQFFGSKPFGVQIKIDWKQFYSFLDDFPEREISLRDKYSYLLNCRAPSLKLVLRRDLESVQNEVREICREEIEQIRQNLENLINEVNEAKDHLFKITSYRKTIPVEPSVLEYFPEMRSTLRGIISLVENGTIPACYREMRKVLENLSWVIFDDLLFYKTAFPRKKHISEFPKPYRTVSKEWYDWASQEKLVIRKLREMEKKINDLTELVYLHGKNNGYGWDKKQIEKIFFKRISYPLFLLLTGVDAQVPKKLEEVIPQYEVGILRSLIIEDLRNVLRDLGRKHPSKSDDALIEELMGRLNRKISRIVPPYPSPEFTLAFVSKTLSSELLEPYKEYSQFVHSYFTSWHIFPFSSVLEFKVFRHELSIFTRTLLQLIDFYLREVFN
ncbi:MAG: hypothetical protein QXO23_06245 [Candidatus Methanomethyliaceae archaeon]